MYNTAFPTLITHSQMWQVQRTPIPMFTFYLKNITPQTVHIHMPTLCTPNPSTELPLPLSLKEEIAQIFLKSLHVNIQISIGW